MKCSFCDSDDPFLDAGRDLPALSKWNVIGAGRRKGVVCSNCKSTDRERLVHLFLQEWLKRRENNSIRVLHVAPEKNLGMFLRLHPKTVRYLAIDLDPSLAEHQMDLRAMSFAPHSFDLVVCNHVLEHIPEDHVAMREIHRVLAPDGMAILQVPITRDRAKSVEGKADTPADRERLFGQSDHVRIYAEDDFAERLGLARLDIIFLSAIDLGYDMVEMYQLNPRESIHVCYPR